MGSISERVVVALMEERREATRYTHGYIVISGRVTTRHLTALVISEVMSGGRPQVQE